MNGVNWEAVGVIVSLFVVLGGVAGWYVKAQIALNRAEPDDDDHENSLRAQVESLRQELRAEKLAREDDNRRAQIEKEDLRREQEELRRQISDLQRDLLQEVRSNRNRNGGR